MLAKDETQHSKIITLLAENIVSIIQSPYGNYAITTALEVSR